MIFERLQLYRLLTATFLHEPTSPFHLIFNMIFLWVVGREMESMYGGREFARMYLTAAVVSSLVWSSSAISAPTAASADARRLRCGHGGGRPVHAVLPEAGDPPLLRPTRADVAPAGRLPRH